MQTKTQTDFLHFKRMEKPTEIKEFLAKADIHNAWIQSYRNKENEAYFEKAFQKAFQLAGVTTQSRILDAGCGSANHAIRLARRGYTIQAVDFSPSALELARQKTEAAGLSNNIRLQQEDLTSLSFPDNSFDAVYCWGVLMHIPNVEAAVKELARVVKPGGHLIISENNKASLEVVLKNSFDKLRHKQHKTEKTAAGLENWYAVKGSDEKLFVRQLDAAWLVRTLESQGMKKRYRIGGQFTEAFIYFQRPFVRKAIHRFNDFWFRFVKSPVGAYSNLFVFQKK